MRVVAIVQGRMSSSRLPGKILREIAGKPMIAHVLERARRAQTLDSVVIATTTDPSDDPAAAFAASMGIPFTRGALHDVLDRYYQAAQTHQAEVIVRITADCPVIDPAVIDQTVRFVTQPSAFNLPPVDFACNRLPPPFGRSFPIGLDVEVCTFAALKRAWQEATEIFHREHVMPFLYENVSLTALPEPLNIAHCSLSTGISPRGFHIAQLHHQPDYGSLRWTVDTPEDLEFIRQVFARLTEKPSFSWYDVLNVVAAEPELTQINAQIHHKTMTDVDERAKADCKK